MNLKNFPILVGSIPQLLILNSEMNLKIFPIFERSIRQLLTLNSEMNLKIFPILRGPFHNFWPSTQKWKFCIDIFYGVSCNIKCITDISNLHFQQTNSKLTFSHGSQLMGKRFMTNLHASLDSTCKSRISKISTRCQNWGSIPQLLNLNSEMNKKFSNPVGVHSTTFDPEVRNGFKNFSTPRGSIPQLLTLNSEMNLKIFPIFGRSIPQLLTLNSEMNLKIFPILREPFQLLTLNSEMKVLHWYLLWGFLQY